MDALGMVAQVRAGFVIWCRFLAHPALRNYVSNMGNFSSRTRDARGLRGLVIYKRSHIGGNCYTETVEAIQVHKYGAHTFHPSDKGLGLRERPCGIQLMVALPTTSTTTCTVL